MAEAIFLFLYLFYLKVQRCCLKMLSAADSRTVILCMLEEFWQHTTIIELNEYFCNHFHELDVSH